MKQGWEYTAASYDRYVGVGESTTVLTMFVWHQLHNHSPVACKQWHFNDKIFEREIHDRTTSDLPHNVIVVMQ